MLVNSDGQPTHASVLLLGAAQVGKSTLSTSFRGLPFDPELYDPTIEEQFHAILMTDSHRLILNLIECGGHPSYQGLLSSAIRAADGFFLVFDVGKRRSFHSIWPFFEQIVETQQKPPQKIPMVLIGTHANDKKFPMRRQVSRSEGQKMAKILGIPYLETAAEHPETIQQCFQRLAKELKKHVSQVKMDGELQDGSRCTSLAPSRHSMSLPRTSLPDPIPGSLRARRDEAFDLWMRYQTTTEESVSLNSDTSIPSSFLSTIGQPTPSLDFIQHSELDTGINKEIIPPLDHGHESDTSGKSTLANSLQSLESLMSEITDFKSSSIQDPIDALDQMLASLPM
jgi:small GTP-binding protein